MSHQFPQIYRHLCLLATDSVSSGLSSPQAHNRLLHGSSSRWVGACYKAFAITPDELDRLEFRTERWCEQHVSRLLRLESPLGAGKNFSWALILQCLESSLLDPRDHGPSRGVDECITFAGYNLRIVHLVAAHRKFHTSDKGGRSI